MAPIYSSIFVVSAIILFVERSSGDPNQAEPGSNDPLKMVFWQALCDQPIPNTASQNEVDCLSKCEQSTTCQYASYDSTEKQCGLIPSGYDCTFHRLTEDKMLLGFAKRTPTIRLNVQLDSAKPLTNNQGVLVIASNLGIPESACAGLCNIYPGCKAAVYSSGRGPSSCSLKASSGTAKRFDTSVTQTMNTAYIFA